jgi:hypothetical protein
MSNINPFEYKGCRFDTSLLASFKGTEEYIEISSRIYEILVDIRNFLGVSEEYLKR